MSETDAKTAEEPSYAKVAISRMIILAIVIAFGFGIAYLADGGFGTLSELFGIALGIQLLFFLHGGGIIFCNEKTERFYDFSGSLTYISLTCYALYVAHNKNFDLSIRQMVLSGCILVWCIRLGSFLFMRITKDGGIDSRFVEIKKNNFRFLTMWGIQALWTFIVGLPVYTILAKEDPQTAEYSITDIIGASLWVIGFLFEVVADSQKSSFKAREHASLVEKRQFINVGLWKISRHPNYFGEIVLWIGVTVAAAGSMEGDIVKICTICTSPLLTTFLLCKVSGIPKLEKAADERWGGEEDYEAYKSSTPVLIPFCGPK